MDPETSTPIKTTNKNTTPTPVKTPKLSDNQTPDKPENQIQQEPAPQTPSQVQEDSSKFFHTCKISKLTVHHHYVLLHKWI